MKLIMLCGGDFHFTDGLSVSLKSSYLILRFTGMKGSPPPCPSGSIVHARNLQESAFSPDIITLDRSRWLTGVTCIAEESSDMSEWVPRPFEVISRLLTRETVRATASADAAASPRRFLRIRFTE